MTLGGIYFGATYFGGAPRKAITITGTAACTMAAATCAGTGTAPTHGSSVVVGGFAFFPFPQKRRAVRGSGACVLAPFAMRATGRRRQNLKGAFQPFVLSVTVTGTGATSDRSRREESLFRLAAALPEEDEASIVLLDTVG